MSKLAFWITIDEVYKQEEMEELIRALNSIGYECYFHQGGRMGVVEKSTDETGKTKKRRVK